MPNFPWLNNHGDFWIKSWKKFRIKFCYRRSKLCTILKIIFELITSQVLYQTITCTYLHVYLTKLHINQKPKFGECSTHVELAYRSQDHSWNFRDRFNFQGSNSCIRDTTILCASGSWSIILHMTCTSTITISIIHFGHAILIILHLLVHPLSNLALNAPRPQQ